MSKVVTNSVEKETLRYLWTPDLSPLFWREGRVGVGSAWYPHVPFAHWIVGIAEPRTLVELGTQNGVSYSAFCEAVVRSCLETRCYAVDTWLGDDHAERYGEEVYWDFRRFHDDRYSAFSELLRCTFDEALPHIPDAAVDLLHIDGLHTYEAVRHDFESWQPKLSERAVVLLHDTNVRQRDFGVWRLWEELRKQFPSFEFLHGYGLGVLSVGNSVPSEIASLCSIREPVKVHAIRERFSLVGERWLLLAQRELQQKAEAAALEARIQSLEKEVLARETRIQSLEKEVLTREAHIQSLESESAVRRQAEVELRARVRQRIAQARADLAKATARGYGEHVLTIPPVAAKARLRLVYISGESNTPGNQYRVLRYVRLAAQCGIDASWMKAEEVPTHAAEIETADILVIWRTPWNAQIETAVSAMRSRGKTVVFDVDDLMTEPDLARVELIDGIRSQFLTEEGTRQHYANMRQTMLEADVCFTATDELAWHTRLAGKTTFVLPNGFDRATHTRSRRARRQWVSTRDDEYVRIGYASGSRTHQRDFALAVEAVAKVLSETPRCRLVLFRTADHKIQLIDVEEYPVLAGLEDRIEWRNLQVLEDLPDELARFDINLAPLEFGNPFCEAKSELKFFEAALVDVPTIASPTGPFRRAIEHGKTGFLAASADDWYLHLKRLIDDPELRAKVARQAYHAALAKFGPMRRAQSFALAVEQLRGGDQAARAFALSAQLMSRPWKAPEVLDSDVVFSADKLLSADVTVVIPSFNYEKFVIEALESVHAQTLQVLDLVIVDGCSTDNSLEVVRKWAASHAVRFNRVLVLRNKKNYGLALCRNSGIDAAETPYVMLLDADNRLLPDCCETLLNTINASSAAFAYPTLRDFGASEKVSRSNAPFEAQKFIAGNYIDAMALVSKEAWACVAGFEHVQHGWEDYDFWSRLAEIGLRGQWCPQILAEYRIHQRSLTQTQMQPTIPKDYYRLMENFTQRHPWVSLIDRKRALQPPTPSSALSDPSADSRLQGLLPILRCPDTKQKLVLSKNGDHLDSVDGLRSWPVIRGRPVLTPGFSDPEIKPLEHVSNEVPDAALDIIRQTDGLVLNLSAGGTIEKFGHVVEVEYAIFRHTDVVGDAHCLPFDDETFSAVIALNAFEHYREPEKVAAELYRVLKSGGRIFIRTAFLQPLHERPWHFYNCTRYGLAQWFKAFETEQLHVSSNFCPNHSIAWLTSECEAALRNDVSTESADAFTAAPIGSLVQLWRDPSQRTKNPLWGDFERLQQPTQEIIAAGFEFVGRRPDTLQDIDK
jgi:glycosyltransferase involved in cell wall biosynthesis/SAM-dependent methyltransferase